VPLLTARSSLRKTRRSKDFIGYFLTIRFKLLRFDAALLVLVGNFVTLMLDLHVMKALYPAKEAGHFG
jgi:hypothetical protein